MFLSPLYFAYILTSNCSSSYNVFMYLSKAGQIVGETTVDGTTLAGAVDDTRLYGGFVMK